jgi:hypothetical protein
MVARERARLLAPSTPGGSIRPPWLAYTAVTAWLSHCHWSALEPAGTDVNWCRARESCDRPGTTSADAASRLCPGRACCPDVLSPLHAADVIGSPTGGVEPDEEDEAFLRRPAKCRASKNMRQRSQMNTDSCNGLFDIQVGPVAEVSILSTKRRILGMLDKPVRFSYRYIGECV